MKDNREKDVIEIEFTEELLEMWTKEYMKKHPRTKNKPIVSPIHESINVWSIMRRPMMNSLKQRWKEFGKFVVDYYGLADLGISKCKCKYIVHKTYVKSYKSSDCDNIVPKFILDSLTAGASGVICDDSSDVIEELTLKIVHEQNSYKSSKIIFYDCEYDKNLLYKTREAELKKLQEKEKTLAENKAKRKAKKK